MRGTGGQRGGDYEPILELAAVIRSVIAGRVHDRALIEDLVQEALTRLLEARPRLNDEVLAAYAVTTARNLTTRHRRSEDVRRRHLHQLVDLRSPTTPEEQAVMEEEKRAIAAALARLSTRDRDTIVARDVMETDLATLARNLGSTPGAVATRLSRTRARLRVDYVLAHRNVTLPTGACRPVLIALSAGDRRRQEALGAAAHLLDCTVCAALGESVMARHRPFSVLWPVAPAGELARRLGTFTRRPAVQVGAAAATATVGALIGYAATDRPAPPRPPPGCVAGAPLSQGVLAANGRQLSVSSGSDLGPHMGEHVVACGVTVQSVPANEGFWIGDTADERLWVEIVTTGESIVRVRPGQRVTLRGTVVEHGPDFPAKAGVDASEGADALARDRYHLEVPETQVRFP